MENNNDVNLLNICIKIFEELQLLTSDIKGNAFSRFSTDFLNTDLKKKIYSAFDGVSDSQLISEQTGASLRLVQGFIKEMIEHDLVEVSKQGRAFIPIKSISKIAVFYSRLDLKKAEEI